MTRVLIFLKPKRRRNEEKKNQLNSYKEDLHARKGELREEQKLNSV